MTTMRTKWFFLVVLLVVAGLQPIVVVQDATAQQRQVRTYVPPDQLVSFPASIPFNTFVEYINPIVVRMLGKEILDPDSREFPIGVNIQGMHFRDAFEMVLAEHGLNYRETDRFFMVQNMTAFGPGVVASMSPASDSSGVLSGPADMETRQIEINAVLFELNHTKSKEAGIDWSVIFGSAGGGADGGAGGGGAGGGGSTGGAGQESSLTFELLTDKLFRPLDNIITSPDRIGFSDLNQLFRLAESQGVGETIASPSVTVQSGVAGDIQIGSDVPVQIRDTFGNISTQLFKTGIIIDVTPTYISEAVLDSSGNPTGEMIDFVHLKAQIEKSNSRPSADGPIIDKTTVNTQAILLDGEQTVVGGLFSTDESINRRGVPILKDLPGWFFGLKYLFGRSQRQISQKELLIAIQVKVINGMRQRTNERMTESSLLEKRRLDVQQVLDQFDKDVSERTRKPRDYKGGNN